MKVALFAYSSIGARALRALLELGQEIVGVWTHPDRVDEEIWFDSVRELAAAERLPVVEVPQRGVAGELVPSEQLASARPDAILSASFRRVLPPSVLELAPRGAYNLHGSLLPRYRGRCPLNWVLVNGESETGMSLHLMTDRVDAGDIVGQSRLEIDIDETAPELQRRLEDAVASVLEETWPRIEAGSARRRPQDESKASTFAGRRPEDGRFEWSWPRLRIHNLVRAVTRPFPGAFFETPDGRRYVWKARLTEDRASPRLAPGELWRPSAADGNRHYCVGAGDGALEVLDGDPP